jgi:hypothetical protein
VRVELFWLLCGKFKKNYLQGLGQVPELFLLDALHFFHTLAQRHT